MPKPTTSRPYRSKKRASATPLRPRRSRIVQTESGPVEIKVANHARARGLRLRIEASGQPKLTVARSVREYEIDDFLRQNEGWLRRELGRHEQRASKLGLRSTGVIWYLGEPLRIVRVKGQRSKARRGQLQSGEIVLAVSGPAAQMAKAIETWYREQARQLAAEIIAAEAPVLGVQVNKLRIGDMKSRWGSANTRGTVSLSWRLLLAPREAFDYVVVHELCHFLEMNHSTRFWAHVARRRPDWAKQKDWLHRHGHELHAWTPEIALGQSTPAGSPARLEAAAA